MVVYKLFRKLKAGSVTSLFINKKRRLPFNQWLDAEDHTTKGYTSRPFWHCVPHPKTVKHLSMKNRVWIRVEIDQYFMLSRPKNQGGFWYLAKKIRLLNEISENIPPSLESGSK